MPQDNRTALLQWLKQRWLPARASRTICQLTSIALIFLSIVLSFIASVAASGVFPELGGAKCVTLLAAGPGLCMTIWKAFPLRQWAIFQNQRYVLYREIYMSLLYEKITLEDAVKMVNEVGRTIGKAAKSLSLGSLSEGGS